MSSGTETRPQPEASAQASGDARRALTLRQLEAYALTHAEEGRTVAAIAELLKTSSEPFSRRQYSPGHLTASGLVVTQDGYIALLFHKKLQLWLQPGGHIEDADESLEAAARREVKEELGLATLQLWHDESSFFDVDIHHIPAFPNADTHQHFDVRFLFRLAQPQTLLSPEALSTRWFSLIEVLELPDVSLARAVNKILLLPEFAGSRR